MGNINEYLDRSQFFCKCGNCNLTTVDVRLVRFLTNLCIEFGQCTITSGNRCPWWNGKQGGIYTSKHQVGQAADITMEKGTPDQWYKALKQVYGNEVGIAYINENTIHVEVN